MKVNINTEREKQYQPNNSRNNTIPDLIYFLKDIDETVRKNISIINNITDEKIKRHLIPSIMNLYNSAQELIVDKSIEDQITNWKNIAIVQDNPLLFSAPIIQYYSVLKSSLINYQNLTRKLTPSQMTQLRNLSITSLVNTGIQHIEETSKDFFGIEKANEKTIKTELEEILKDSILNPDKHIIK